ncbi:hypothetical protein NPIL_177291 [Nephila pilipes]|uniref:Uncharacterized protein n=1 Tax=Nephila pilipes TaxID=299642 RepID=A0A8X6U186_NEPPI|nr:hypothetical protein NPIL_177291 [Nephila pilipes]
MRRNDHSISGEFDIYHGRYYLLSSFRTNFFGNYLIVNRSLSRRKIESTETLLPFLIAQQSSGATLLDRFAEFQEPDTSPCFEIRQLPNFFNMIWNKYTPKALLS